MHLRCRTAGSHPASPTTEPEPNGSDCGRLPRTLKKMRRLFWLEVLRALRRFPAMPRHWMVKSEPASYSWEQFTKDGHAAWTGVRNFQARNNLRAMKTGDIVLFYHSVTGKEVVGIAKVAREVPRSHFR